MKNFTGFIIRQQRLDKGLSQEALCRGICAVSYLSKIEQGMSNPSPAILQQLLDRLNIRYNRDGVFLDRARQMLAGYFDKYFHSETAEEENAFLKLHQSELENSELHLDWHLYQLFAMIQKQGKNAPLCHQEAAYLGRFQENMETDQLFLYYVGCGLLESAEQIEYLKKAEMLRPLSFIKQSIAECWYTRRDTMKAIDAAQEAFRAAAEEGSIPTLLWSSYLLGTCYAGFRDLSFMLRYYRRALELARGYDATITSLIRFNIGSAYLEHREWQSALPELLASMEPADSSLEEQKVLAAAKAAICCFELKDTALGRQYLQQAKNRCTEHMPGLYRDFLEFITLHYLEAAQEQPSYDECLRRLYERSGEILGDGTRRLLSDYLEAHYMSQRRYKEALALRTENDFRG